MRRRALGAAALCVALLSPWPPARDAAGEARPRAGGRATGTLLGRPSSLDPVMARSHAEVTVAGLVFDTLYQLDERGAAIPHLATSLPIVSSDGTQVRIELVSGLGFHDGRPLGPADVVASLARSRAHGGLLAPLAAVRAEDAVVVIELRRPCPELATLLAAPSTSVTPAGKAPGEQPVGSGPFVLTAIDERKRELRLVASPSHVAGRPYLDALVLRWFETADGEPRAYEAGELDLSMRGAVAFAGHQPKHATEVAASPATLLVFVGFGRAHRAALAEPELRRALHLAIGRGGLAGLGSGEKVAPTVEPVAAALGGSEPAGEQLVADDVGARAALSRAVAKVGALSGQRFELIVDHSRPDDREVGEKVVAALYRLGLTASIRELGAAEFAARVARGACDFFVGHLAAPTSDPGAAWAVAFAAGGDDWAASALAAAPLDPARARAAFALRLPIVPLFHRAVRVHHRAELRRVELDLMARIGHADVFTAIAARARR